MSHTVKREAAASEPWECRTADDIQHDRGHRISCNSCGKISLSSHNRYCPVCGRGTITPITCVPLKGNTVPEGGPEDTRRAVEYLLDKVPAQVARYTAKMLWKEFGDVPINSETECLEENWYIFPEGTHREYIWRWFENTFHVCTARDLMGQM